MKDIILKRCCGNCDWSISPECEEEIIKENYYDEDDYAKPKAGDCCLGIEHNGEYFCKHHTYISEGLDTYAFYDDKDLGPGYYVVNEYYDNVIRYFKLYRTGEYGKYSYGIRVYETNPITCNSTNNIIFEITEINNKLLYKLFSIFAKTLGNNLIRDNNTNGIVTADINKYSVSINFSKTINNIEKDNNYIDIKVNYNKEDINYRLIEHLYRNMAVATSNKKDEDSKKKIRRLN